MSQSPQSPPTSTEHHPDTAGILELFLQRQGRPEFIVLRMPESATVADLLQAALEPGTSDGECLDISASDADEPLDRQSTLHAAGIGQHGRLHCHACRRVAVTVRFNGIIKEHDFPAAARISRVHDWATGKQGFKLSDTDAADHVLQVAGSMAQPAPTDHLGSIVSKDCAVVLDLVPKSRIEG